MKKIQIYRCNMPRTQPLMILKRLKYPFNRKKQKAFIKNNPLIMKKYDFNKNPGKHLYDIPVFIISYNRLSYVKQMVEWLKKYNLHNIHIIDNASSYPPLLEYLKNCPCTVHRMDKNWGHEVLWRCGKFNRIIRNSLYIVSDPDIAPNDKLPKDFLFHMYKILGQYKNITKVGFALSIQDTETAKIDPQYKIYEKHYWTQRLVDEKLEIYNADIDTTFALYRPGKLRASSLEFYFGIRIGGDYTAKHLPWYININKGTEEDVYYKTHADLKFSTWARNLINK